MPPDNDPDDRFSSELFERRQRSGQALECAGSFALLALTGPFISASNNACTTARDLERFVGAL